MKKAILSLLFVAGVAFVASAQLSAVGAKGGVNFANQKFDADGFSVSPDSRTSIHLGGFAVFGISNNISIQPELLYSGKGSKVDFGGVSSTTKLSYIDIPVLGRYNINEMFSVHAGPQLSFLLAAEDEDGNDIKDFLTTTDIGFGFGGQVDLESGLVAGLRYVTGLSDINDDGGGTKIRNRAFQLYVGWRFMSN